MKNKEVNKIKAAYRMVFKKDLGPEVLGHILLNPCRFFGKIEGDDRITNTEIFVRQQVGREILMAMDCIPGPFCKSTPDEFVNKLLMTIEDRRKR